MKKKSIIITLIFLISTLIQLVSQIVITRLFGASLVLDTFLAAVTLPTIIVTIIYSTLNDAFLPLYSEKKIKNEDNSLNYFWSTVYTLTTVSLLVGIIISLFSSQIMSLFFSSSRFNLTEVARQFSLMIYAIPLACIATLFGSFYYADKKLLRFPTIQAIGSIVNIAFILLFYKTLGIWSLVYAFLVNILLQIPFIIPRFKLTSLRNVGDVLWPWSFLIISAFAVRSDTLLIRSFGSGLGEGYLVYLNLISKVFSLSTGILTIGIQVILLPNLVDLFIQKNTALAFKMINKAKMIALGISLTATLLLYLITPMVLRLLFVGGEFSEVDLNKTIELLPLFLIPAIAWGVNNIFFQPLIALKKTKELMIINIFSIILAWSISSYFASIGLYRTAISFGLSVLLLSGIIGSEVIWQMQKRKFTN